MHTCYTSAAKTLMARFGHAMHVAEGFPVLSQHVMPEGRAVVKWEAQSPDVSMVGAGDTSKLLCCAVQLFC